MQEEQWLKLHPNAKIALIIKPMIGITFLVIFIMIQFILVGLSAGLLIFLLILAGFIAILFSIVIVWAIMFYNRYMFRIGGDAVYINRGILWKRNVVIPYERIQHTSMTRGPIDILLGLHILNIFTAGTGSVGARFGGVASAFAAEGSIPGLADPKPFQDAIMAKVRALRGDGIGAVPPAVRRTTPEVPLSQSSTQGAYPVAAQSDPQEEMLTELRRIREILEKQGKN